MVKVLLVFEDFNELTLTETYLKKVGFDVVGISNEVLLADQILSFNPEIIVAFGKNSRVSSFSIGQKMKDNHRYHGKLVIIVPKDVRPSPNEIIKMKMDGILEAPVDPEKLVQVLARLAGQSATGYIEKLQKARLTDPEMASRLVSRNSNGSGNSSLGGSAAGTGSGSSGGSSAAGFSNNSGNANESSSEEHEAKVIPLHGDSKISFNDPERVKKYAEFTKDLEFDIQQSTHQRKDLKDKLKELKKSWDFDTLDELDEARRQFAEALFKKK